MPRIGRGQRTVARRALALALCLGGTAAGAAEVTDARIRYRAGVYRVEMEALLDAPSSRVRSVLRDGDRMAAISPSISDIGIVEAFDDGQDKRRTQVKTCVLVFCFDFVMTEVVRVDEDGHIHARLLPEESDFRSGEGHWYLHEEDDGRTRLRYESRREPRFWIPPLIGPAVMQRKLLRELDTTMVGIEEAARDMEAGALAGH